MKLIKFEHFDKPHLQSQNEIKIASPLTRTPKSAKSQTFITFKQSPTNQNKDCVHKSSLHRPHHKSQFSQQFKSQHMCAYESNKTDTLQECISILLDIKQTSQLLYRKKSNNVTNLEKMQTISNLIEEMLPKNYSDEQKNQLIQNEEKIKQMMKQLMQEKEQKYQAIKSGDNLIKQQQEQIQYLKARISLYNTNDQL